MPERPITPAVLDEHDALREAATPGPWEQGGPVWTDSVRGVCHCGSGDPTPQANANAAYITALANDHAALIARVRELEAALRVVRGITEQHDLYALSACGGWTELLRVHIDAALYPGEPDHSQDALAMTWRKDPE